jgi:hypothetical protein
LAKLLIDGTDLRQGNNAVSITALQKLLKQIGFVEFNGTTGTYAGKTATAIAAINKLVTGKDNNGQTLDTVGKIRLVHLLNEIADGDMSVKEKLQKIYANDFDEGKYDRATGDKPKPPENQRFGDYRGNAITGPSGSVIPRNRMDEIIQERAINLSDAPQRLYYVKRNGPTVQEAAKMAEHVYHANLGDTDDKRDEGLIGGWKLLNINSNESLKMGVYYRVLSNGNTEYAVVNKGTSEIGDWDDNLLQMVGLSKDVDNSISFAEQFVKEHPDDNITFVGHSKGGAEAVANAITTDKDVMVFNPAYVNYPLNDLDIKDYNKNMEVYIVEGEILNMLFGDLTYRNNITRLPAQHPYDPIGNHGQNAVNAAINDYYSEE